MRVFLRLYDSDFIRKYPISSANIRFQPIARFKCDTQTAPQSHSAAFSVFGCDKGVALTARKLMFLWEWNGTAHGAATETDTLTKLIDEAYTATA